MQLGRVSVFGLRLAVAVVVAMMATAGAMALTGVDLPEEANDRAVRAVQEAGPGSNGDKDEEAESQLDEREEGPDENASPTAHAVHDVIANWEGERGCEFGMAVRQAAGGTGPENDPCAQGENGEAGAEARATGLDRAEQGGDGDVPEGSGPPEGSDPSEESDGSSEQFSGNEIGAERSEHARGGRP